MISLKLSFHQPYWLIIDGKEYIAGLCSPPYDGNDGKKYHNFAIRENDELFEVFTSDDNLILNDDIIELKDSKLIKKIKCNPSDVGYDFVFRAINSAEVNKGEK